ncbi:FAD-binding oxidoreductase [Stappia sp. ES.058]|uniref:NAD(P)/FAD-dependent oxidoreductase n=1 Tax=Stappia sp. ES.058 TaxID=1881061 RepID=UPI000879F229|nr:FAD-binding oxidoreductase [Stappia sp. ES.058]SDU14464.1 D-arginine dehydrogenase [Stappia sp. ES.058]
MQSSDFLIIGGGIAGVGVAAHLADSASVTVLETEDALGRHSTGRSAAIFIKNYGNATLRALNAASEQVLASGGDFAETGFLSPRGELVIAMADEVDALDAYLAGAEGMDVISPAEAVRMVPILREELIAKAAMEPDARDIDVDRLLQSFARHAKRLGARLVQNAPATSIRREGDAWRVEAGGEVYHASVLINAAGAWADEVAGLAGASKVGMQAMRRSAAILPAPDGHDVSRWPAVVSASESWYAKPEAGKLMVSPADEDPVDPHDAWPDDMVMAEGLYRFETATNVPVTRVERTWAGLRSFVADRTPVAGFAPETPGFFWLAGQGGYGIQTAPALSRLAADMCLGREPALGATVVSALDPGRLARV